MKNKINKYLQIFILLLTAIVFTPSLQGDFLNWDDTTYITSNEILNENIGIQSFRKIYAFDAKISLSLFSFQLQKKLFGDDPFYFHLINILIHLINIFLVFYLTRIIFHDNIASFWIALIFAIHPYNAESVAWIMQRKDLLFTMFFLLGTLFYIKFLKTDQILFFLLTIILAYLAILSKISAITLGLTLLLVEFYIKDKITLKSLLFILIIGLVQLTFLDSIGFFALCAFIPLIIIHISKKMNYKQLYNDKTQEKNNIKEHKLKYLLSKYDTINLIILFYLILFIVFKSSIITNFIVKSDTLSSGLFIDIITYFLPVFILFILNDRNQKQINKWITYLKSPWTKSILLIVLLSFAAIFIYYESIPKFEPGEFSLINIVSLKTLFYFSHSLMYYIMGFFFPFYQNSMYPYPDGESLNILYKLAPIALLIAAILAFYFIKKIKNKSLQREIIFGLIFFFINISIVLHIIPIKGRIIVAERYTYLAYLGLIIASVFIIKHFFYQSKPKQQKAILFFALLLISGYSIQTYARSKVFKNSYVFWTDIIDKNSENHYAIFALGLHYYENNEYATAIKNYSKSISINSENHEYYLNRGSSYLKIDSINLAINDYDKAIDLNAKNPIAFKNRGILHYRTGNLENTVLDLETSLKLDSNDKEAFELYNSANALFIEYQESKNDGKKSSIVSQYFFDLGTNRAKEGKYLESLSFFNESTKLDSLNIDALKNRGNVFAILKRFEQAINDYENALKIDPLDAGIYLNLGNVFHQSGSLKSACANWQKALDLGKIEAKKPMDKYCK